MKTICFFKNDVLNFSEKEKNVNKKWSKIF